MGLSWNRRPQNQGASRGSLSISSLCKHAHFFQTELISYCRISSYCTIFPRCLRITEAFETSFWVTSRSLPTNKIYVHDFRRKQLAEPRHTQRVLSNVNKVMVPGFHVFVGEPHDVCWFMIPMNTYSYCISSYIPPISPNIQQVIFRIN